MEFKLFGKSLFEVKRSKVDFLYSSGVNELKESKFLPDFQSLYDNTSGVTSFLSISDAVTRIEGEKEKQKETKKEPEKKAHTPKDVYNLKLLHDQTFKLKTDPAYVEEQLTNFKEKMEMVMSEEYDMRRGTAEISSIVARLENRKKYPEFKEFYEEFPYTTSAKVSDLVKEHTHLQLGKIAQFVADMPKEATDVMKKYSAKTKELCGKLPVYYLIADKKDFQKTEKRRDPILLAQSPFGHFWQILGAWDEEMLLVDEL